jgi:hypothetical protein
MAKFENVPSGVVLYVGIREDDAANVSQSEPTTLDARLVSTDPFGAGAFSATAATSTASGGLAPVTLSGGTGIAVWEVMTSNALAVETAYFPYAVAYTSNTSNNLPALGTANVRFSFAPQSSVTTASASAPVPRFADTSVQRTLLVINACSANLLFPYVTQQSGFDTGLVISNTSLDTTTGGLKNWGPTTPQNGACSIYYFGETTGGGAAPAQQTSQSVAAGKQLIWTLFAGGVTDTTIKPTPGFQGYIIASCAFQYAHGFAFISDLGAQKLAMGYLALILDGSLGARTPFFTESLVH